MPIKSHEPPDILIEIIDDLDARTVRAVRTYIEQRLDELRLPIQEEIRSEADGEIINIEARGAYALVQMYPPSQGDERVPHPLFLYRVTREKQLDGGSSLHWSYLGDVIKKSQLRCRNCGTRFNTYEMACPHCGEETAHDNGGV